MSYRVLIAAFATVAITTASIVTAIGQNPPFLQCPPVGQDTSCGILLVITNNGITVRSDPSQGPYDGIEDTLVGVQNNSTQTLFSLPLSSPVAIFGFDGDGLCTYGIPGCPFGPTGYEGPGISFSGINPSRTAGIVNFSGGLAPGHSAYFSLEEAIQTLCQPIAGVPLLKQGGPSAPWRNTTYDHTAKTIGALGCNLTCCAMLINYHASAQGVAFSTTPDLLNTWLNDHSGYDSTGGVDPYAVAAYARTVGHVLLVYEGRVDQRDDFVLDNYLCTGNPVVLKILHPRQHFVLATGQTVVNGTDTFLINDPGFNNSTLAGYNFTYAGIRKYSSSIIPPNALLITGHSPIELLISDPSGHRTGFDPRTGERFNQIPNGSYSLESLGDDEDPTGTAMTPETKVLDLPTPSSGIYTLQVIGTGTGPFTIDFKGYDTNGNPSTATVTGNATVDSSATYRVHYSSLPGSQITVDSDCPPGTCCVCHKQTTTLSLPCDSLEYRRHIDHGDTAGPCKGSGKRK